MTESAFPDGALPAALSGGPLDTAVGGALDTAVGGLIDTAACGPLDAVGR